ncbi:ATP-dependent 6-phosphofructokinase [Oxynema aestuarii]|jgi:6-phosphofructokinase|uniref:ATP-dependent 6-phosphofructokinase n=1 Tax=Oxynema aestuarii AP17 TaxID=2064643 RepID=A0A6H1TZ14_9CYAN|nr:ATP-dependent 6-phosphofructokinase [Oxynema aestuarii]QIZ71842.1 6-phosphofructokinase [Oxynema aestuarii AP17]RMH76692.1 MAG: 6-phosphofructokinase [Cyanobacteria bacterium J007]
MNNSSKKRIGILTSGGDCPGLNAVIRAVVKCASHKGWEVYGIPYGTDGFIDIANGDRQPEDLKLYEHGYDIPGLLQGLDVLQFLSGSVLGSLSKGNTGDPEIAEKIIQGYNRLELDALIGVGGDGSLEILYQLAQKGQWKLIGVPKTIDNDVPFTERSVGFDTAVDTVTEALYDLTFTAASHERVMVVEVMGRDAGHLALHAGIAGGADVILIPELTPIVNEEVVHNICHKIARLHQEKRKFALVVVAEGVKHQDRRQSRAIGDYVAKQIKAYSKHLCDRDAIEFCGMQEVDTRVTVLGHLQRSGTPSSFDRLLATSFGIKAVQLIDREQYNRLVVWEGGKVESKPLEQAIALISQAHQQQRCPSPVDSNGFMVQSARSLGIYVGDPSAWNTPQPPAPTVEVATVEEASQSSL